MIIFALKPAEKNGWKRFLLFLNMFSLQIVVCDIDSELISEAKLNQILTVIALRQMCFDCVHYYYYYYYLFD